MRRIAVKLQHKINTGKLEHRSQKIVSFRHYLIRQFRYTILTSVLVFFSLLIGVIGYHYFGKLTWLESFHMASMILTGMGPVNQITTESGIVFSSFYALYSGIAFLSITAVFFTPMVHRILHILHVDKK